HWIESRSVHRKSEKHGTKLYLGKSAP
ncbi:unnamed protein product, partial [Oikopleura dioica]